MSNQCHQAIFEIIIRIVLGEQKPQTSIILSLHTVLLNDDGEHRAAQGIVKTCYKYMQSLLILCDQVFIGN